ncbi:usg protein [Rhodopseudomonas sp. B29]|uniref:usg protein n=1 Tax=Rhodopseudomonas sp. B29 TaxID=95607 RepID=UPI00034B5A3D|nr:protein usg [Rhodopseudomonas sp. B29]
MVGNGAVSEDFRKQVLGYGLTTAEILYWLPDHPNILQTYLWQEYDLAPDFPTLKGFLKFWKRDIEGKLHEVRVSHNRLIGASSFDSAYLLSIN